MISAYDIGHIIPVNELSINYTVYFICRRQCVGLQSRTIKCPIIYPVLKVLKTSDPLEIFQRTL